jgi:hypothetical protein
MFQKWGWHRTKHPSMYVYAYTLWIKHICCHAQTRFSIPKPEDTCAHTHMQKRIRQLQCRWLLQPSRTHQLQTNFFVRKLCKHILSVHVYAYVRVLYIYVFMACE